MTGLRSDHICNSWLFFLRHTKWLENHKKAPLSIKKKMKMEGGIESHISFICTHCLAKLFHGKHLLLWVVCKTAPKSSVSCLITILMLWSGVPPCVQVFKEGPLCVAVCGQGMAGWSGSKPSFLSPQPNSQSCVILGKSPTVTDLMRVHTIYRCIIEGPWIS